VSKRIDVLARLCAEERLPRRTRLTVSRGLVAAKAADDEDKPMKVDELLNAVMNELKAITKGDDADEAKKAQYALDALEGAKKDDEGKAMATAVHLRLSPGELELLAVGVRKPVAEVRATRRGNVTQMPIGISQADAKARLAELEKEGRG
jgi:hypothetical protein